jgi:hypothetical protein
MAEPQLKRRLTIPREFDSNERQLVGRLVISFIQDRTAKGKDINNASFKPYSDDYKDSVDFDIAGKTNRVNLSQSGDTIASIEVLSHGTGFVTIGYEAGSFENDKAVWLQRSDNGASRKFLGLTDADLDSIILKVDKQRGPSNEDRIRQSIADAIVQNILAKLGI